MGPPGSGKGTQAARIADTLGVTRVSTGDLFREHQQKDTQLGRLARSYMRRGVYVPDDVTIKMVMDWISAPQQGNGFVLDGFPRTMAQAEALDQQLVDKGGIDKVIYIDVSLEELVSRLTGRLICRRCQTPYHMKSSLPKEAGTCDACGADLYQRDDDKPDVVSKRIQVYTEQTEPVVQHYRQAGKLVRIAGERPIEDVGQALVEAVA